MCYQAFITSLTLAQRVRDPRGWSALYNSSEVTESPPNTAVLRLELLAGCQAPKPGSRREGFVELSSDLCKVATVYGPWCLCPEEPGVGTF